MKNPSCSEFRVWKGAEVEGTAGKGQMTLFIRSLEGYAVTPEEDLSFFKTKTKCTRVWFCKEFTDWEMVKAIAKHFDEVCIETEPKNFESIPKVLRARCRIYLKIAVPLKDGDFVCVGPAFADEAFEIGTGSKVKPEDYNNDIRIL